VNVTRSVAYFRGAGITQPTLLVLLWAAIAAGMVAIAWRRQPRPRQPASTEDGGHPQREPLPTEPHPALGL